MSDQARAVRAWQTRLIQINLQADTCMDALFDLWERDEEDSGRSVVREAELRAELAALAHESLRVLTSPC